MADVVKRIPITPGDLTDHQWGTDDTLSPSGGGLLIVYGDAGGNMSDHSKGGDDTIIVDSGPSFGTIIYGYAVGNMSDHSKGGNDTIYGYQSGVYGDAGATCPATVKAATIPSLAAFSTILA